jgi:hypothetical protein
MSPLIVSDTDELLLLMFGGVTYTLVLKFSVPELADCCKHDAADSGLDSARRCNMTKICPMHTNRRIDVQEQIDVGELACLWPALPGRRMRSLVSFIVRPT